MQERQRPPTGRGTPAAGSEHPLRKQWSVATALLATTTPYTDELILIVEVPRSLFPPRNFANVRDDPVIVAVHPGLRVQRSGEAATVTLFGLLLGRCALPVDARWRNETRCVIGVGTGLADSDGTIDVEIFFDDLADGLAVIADAAMTDVVTAP
ncbi:hypothetical protein GCM10009661_29350 [Catellatospora chokoriensis]|uniref:Uncharacterized protein n=2 Tax=Catellatospora chokoriensis TaxID=310353 RepID=A0A8J3JRL4_9ACTN|nr:hypothetical protein Cch02nite_32700 [Catellatospora chokoriensis]